jgi:hypothetical protein
MLRTDPFKIYGVFLQYEPTIGHLGGPIRKLSLRSPYRSPAAVWAFQTRESLYVNGAAMYRTENIQKMLELEGYDAEEQFSALVKKLHWKFVFPDENCRRRGPFSTPAYFTYIGEGSSTGNQTRCQIETFN